MPASFPHSRLPRLGSFRTLWLSLGMGLLVLPLQAQQRITHPQVLCEEAGRTELRRQFEKLGLADTEVNVFCLRFAPTALEEEPVDALDLTSTETAEITTDNQTLVDNETALPLLAAEEPALVEVALEDSVSPGTEDLISNEPETETEAVVAQESLEEVPANDLSVPPQEMGSVDLDTEKPNETEAWLTDLRWQIAVGEVSSSYLESGPSTQLRGNQWELRLQRLLDSGLMLGVVQTRRLLKGNYHSSALSRELQWEQQQVGGTIGFDWQGEAGIGLRGGLLGGWEDNRLHYQLNVAGVSYFSDDIVNNQGWWGMEFGPRWEFSSNWITGFRFQQQLDRTQIRYADGTQARLQPNMGYVLWLEYQ